MLQGNIGGLYRRIVGTREDTASASVPDQVAWHDGGRSGDKLLWTLWPSHRYNACVRRPVVSYGRLP